MTTRRARRERAQGSPRRVGDLVPASYNPRKITDEQLARLGGAMEAFGDLSGLVVNRRTGHIIGGHQRVKHLSPDATIHITEEHESPTSTGTVAVGFVEHAGERWTFREVDVDETTEVAMNIAANKHGGEFETGLLAPLLSELDAGGFEMDLTGFDESELERLLVDPEHASGSETLLDQAVQLRPAREYVVVMCETEEEWEALKQALELRPVRRGGYKAGSPFDATGTQRVVPAADLLARLEADA